MVGRYLTLYGIEVVLILTLDGLLDKILVELSLFTAEVAEVVLDSIVHGGLQLKWCFSHLPYQ